MVEGFAWKDAPGKSKEEESSVPERHADSYSSAEPIKMDEESRLKDRSEQFKPKTAKADIVAEAAAAAKAR
eukprot:5243322-Karenia_brevis.AAC.1